MTLLTLDTQPHFGHPGLRQRHAYGPGDDFYDALISAHRGLSDEQSELMQARLVLLLANHIGDLEVLKAAIALARRGVETAGVGVGEGVSKGAGGAQAASGKPPP